MFPPALEFRDVAKVYPRPGGRAHLALRDVSASIPRGRNVAIIGRSGSGKSTFLHLAAGIDLPTSGRVLVNGRDLAELSEADRSTLRRDTVGLVFQFFHLLPHLSVIDNVVLPAWIAGEPSDGTSERARELLDRVALADRASEPVQNLSGGEMQRVALCRALLRKPALLLADEPTGNLDDATSRVVMDLLLRLTAEEGSSLVYVTHSLELAALADERWRLHSGTLETAVS